jgi:flagellar biosynthesis/type III secretory pathway protein FliH
MQSIQPRNLSNEEVLHQVYLMGNENLPKEWVEVLCERFAVALDWYQDRYDEGFADGSANGLDYGTARGFQEGFAAGVEHANEFPLNK